MAEPPSTPAAGGGATAPRLGGAESPGGSLETGEKYGKVSQVSLRFWTRIQRAISLLLLAACAYLACTSWWYARPARALAQPRERPVLGLAAAPAPALAAPAAPETVADRAMAAAEAAAAAAAAAGGGSGGAHAEEPPPPPPSWAAAEPSSCAGFFGNGYAAAFPLVAPAVGAAAGGGSLSCHFHPALTATYCRGTALVLHPARITVSRGGEKLEDVMGRTDAAELPVFDAGAAQVVEEGLDALPAAAAAGAVAAAEASEAARGAPLQELAGSALAAHLAADTYKLGLLTALRRVSAAAPAAPACAVRIREPVLALTRMEYVNLFHTSTDWYNAWSTARILGLEPVGPGPALEALRASAKGFSPGTQVTPFFGAPKVPAHVLFLDGHNEGAMDEGWLGLFVSISYIKHFEGPVCFDNLVLAPFGYQAALSMGIIPKAGECRGSAHVRQFGDDMVRGLALGPPRARSSCSEPEPRTLFVRRVHYLVHPRHDGKVVRRLENEDAIWGALEAATGGGGSGVRVVNGVLSSLGMRRQVALAQDACVIVGAHGAGLSHVLFAPPEVHLLEIQTPGFQRPHFVAYTAWAGSHHHLWALPTSSPDVHSVVSRVLETAQHASIEGKEDSHGHGGGSGSGGAADHPGHNE